MGPPGGAPEATLSATDLSMNGLFIDADRPVRVGARFSLEIPMRGDEPAHIPIAEVAYNRRRPHGCGFGVRFVEAPAEALARIQAAVAAHASSTLAPSQTFSVVDSRNATAADVASDLPTIVPTTRAKVERTEPASLVSKLDIDFSEYPEPELVDLPSTPRESVMPSRAPLALGSALLARNGIRLRFLERARCFPNVWRGLMAIGATAIGVSVALALWEGTRAEALDPGPEISGSGVTTNTERVLMGERKIEPLTEPVPPKADTPREPTRALPPLVVVEELEAIPLEKPPARETAAPSPRTASHATQLASPPEAESQRNRSKMRFGISKGAKVASTHVFRSPDRFVIDLEGQREAPELPTPSTGIERIRVGKHPDRTRLVVDAKRPIGTARATKVGDRLDVVIDFVP